MTNKNLVLSRLIKGMILAGIMVSGTLPVLANKNKAASSAGNAEPAVQYIRSDEAGTLLAVQFGNEHQSKFSVILRDEAGNTLYRKNYEAGIFSKTFKLVNESGENEGNVSVIISVDGGSEYVYTVNTSVNVTRDVQVNKI